MFFNVLFSSFPNIFLWSKCELFSFCIALWSVYRHVSWSIRNIGICVLYLTILVCSVQAQGVGLWCYKCVSTHPGCGKNFDWRWHWSYTCPDPNDKCVKIVEKKGAEEIITRDCLSSIKGIRRDIPADIYEGCRPAARDIRLAQYVFNDIDELDIKR